MYIPDPIEQGVMRAERWADENMVGDKSKCPQCDKWYNADEDGEAFIWPDPYAPPVCGKCGEEYMKMMEQNKND